MTFREKMEAEETGAEKPKSLRIRSSIDADVEAMLAIYRRHIRQGIEEGVEDSGVPEPNDLRDRRKNLQDRRYPHLVAVEHGEVLGYAYVVPFRKRPAYRFSVKHSIYIRHDQRRLGVGAALLQALIDACAASGFRRMIGYIDADNTASLALHEKLGFTRAGSLTGAAYRNGRWSDTVLIERSLGHGSTTPPPPIPLSKM
ncbi:MAG TPA: GNAT family N-acetyltransferase [Stellaceae bacterium]|nr:GNAT family N-acetyltransferase [Stellaceae bacterium]